MPFMSYLARHNNNQIVIHHSTEKARKQRSHVPPPLHRKRQLIGEYWLGRTIGRGSSGRVKIGIHRRTGEEVAIKVISRSQLATSATMARCLQRELAVLQLLHHPHLVDLRQVLQDSSNVYFVMEYLEGGELFQVLAERGRLPESEARHLFRQLTTALSWCHAHHICHRDLKPENILLDKDRKNLKIADFGMATVFGSMDTLLQTSCGSPHYASPEIVRGKPYDGQSTDVWSCGVVLYAMLAGHLPFDDSHVSRLLAKIKLGKFVPLPSHVSREAADLIKSMLTVDPSKRITLDAVLAHPWLTNKSYLGTELRFPDALPIHLQKIHDPLQHLDLKKPMIADVQDLSGRIWETLKVLWRDVAQEELVAALASERPNLPKLTCRLLQERAWRQMGTPPPLQEDSGSIVAPMTPPLTPFCEDNNFPSYSTMSCGRTTIVDMPQTPESIPTLELEMSWHSEIQLQPVADNATQVRLFKSGVDDRKSSSLALMRPTTTAADPVVARFDHAQGVLVQPVREDHGRHSSFFSWIGRWCMDLVSPRQQTCHYRATKESPVIFDPHQQQQAIALERSAKHECEAAAKLHQILEQHFQGKLSGRVYPTGQIVWNGSLLHQGMLKATAT
ncbi:kinase-like domain-containing protein [Dichotomocladium elegans]|nr:kinase-like domain-containing protein [Dichotomocladium elegans]